MIGYDIWKSRSDSPVAKAPGADPPSMPSRMGLVVIGIFLAPDEYDPRLGFSGSSLLTEQE